MIKIIFNSPVPRSRKMNCVFNERKLGYYVPKIINPLWQSRKTQTLYRQNAKVKNAKSGDSRDDHSGSRFGPAICELETKPHRKTSINETAEYKINRERIRGKADSLLRNHRIPYLYLRTAKWVNAKDCNSYNSLETSHVEIVQGQQTPLKIWLQGSYRDIAVTVNGTGIIDNNYGVPHQITFNKRSVATVSLNVSHVIHKQTKGSVLTDIVTAGPQQACHVKVIQKMGHFVSKYVTVGSIRGHSKHYQLCLTVVIPMCLSDSYKIHVSAKHNNLLHKIMLTATCFDSNE